MAARVFFDPQSVDVPNVAAFVAYYDDLPLSGAMTFVTHQVAHQHVNDIVIQRYHFNYYSKWHYCM